MGEERVLWSEHHSEWAIQLLLNWAPWPEEVIFPNRSTSRITSWVQQSMWEEEGRKRKIHLRSAPQRAEDSAPLLLTPLVTLRLQHIIALLTVFGVMGDSVVLQYISNYNKRYSQRYLFWTCASYYPQIEVHFCLITSNFKEGCNSGYIIFVRSLEPNWASYMLDKNHYIINILLISRLLYNGQVHTIKQYWLKKPKNPTHCMSITCIYLTDEHFGPQTWVKS